MENRVKIPQKVKIPICVSLVTQLCPTLLNPMGCNPPGSYVHGMS